ncbi:hypothetical protein [Paenibacillus sp. sgz500958]|uniref:hypothetical protein n=1 Tax=Paenibacillus sp. sgz500958 TaxID=3242475 RepID=UPI0036D405EC
MARPVEITTGKEIVLSNLSDDFQLQITMKNEKDKGIDWYTLKTEYFRYRNIDKSRGLTGQLLVTDYYGELTDLETVLRQLGIGK